MIHPTHHFPQEVILFIFGELIAIYIIK